MRVNTICILHCTHILQGGAEMVRKTDVSVSPFHVYRYVPSL